MPTSSAPRERLHARRVVGAVVDGQRILGDHLHAPRNLHASGDLGHQRGVELAVQRAGGGHRHGEVGALVARRLGVDRRGGHDLGVHVGDEVAHLAVDGPVTSVAPGLTTASFSSAMCRSVGPSQRVCSRPTLVSTTTGASSTLVASWRPPRPASTTATSTPRRGQLGERRGREELELGDAVALPSVRSTSAAAPAARWTAAPKASGPRSASPIRTRSANDVRCGERYVPVRTPCVSRMAALIRAVDDLPLVPTTCTDAEPLVRRIEDRHQPAHAVEPEAHAEQLEREQVALCVLVALSRSEVFELPPVAL